MTEAAPLLMDTALMDTASTDLGGSLPQTLRAAARARLAETGFPVLKTEDWKYTSLRALESRESYSSPVDTAFIQRQLQEYFGADMPALCLVFAGGRLQQNFSRLDGLQLDRERAGSAAERLLAQLGGREDAFVRLCLARAAEAWSLSVDACDVDASATQADSVVPVVHIVHLSPAPGTTEQALSADHLFLHVNVNHGQRVDCVEHCLLQDGQFYNQCLVLDLAQEAHSHHLRLIRNAGRAIHFARTQVIAQRESVYSHADAIAGGQLVRHEARIHYAGSSARAALASGARLAGRTRVDQDWLMVHSADRCHSEQYFRAAVDDRAAATYTGRARIAKDINGSVVHQVSRGLMLSSDAEVNARPVLEIYADEVQASHGATVGCLDEDALHYLKTRGVPADIARQMLIESFVNAAFDHIQNEALLALLLSFFGTSQDNDLSA